MSGRMLVLPKPNKSARDVLFVYGMHTSLERMYAVAASLHKETGVIMPDLPGFGGMDSMYSIGMEPTLDNLADYLATVIKLQFPGRKHFSIAGFSYGFSVVTRLLQKYPEIAKQVDSVVSVAGFSDKDDFMFKRRNFYMLKALSRVFSRRIPAWLVQTFVLRGIVITSTYQFLARRHPKLKHVPVEQRPELIKFEIHLWQDNDFRTYAKTGQIMFGLHGKKDKVSLPLHHIQVKGDQFLDADGVIKRLGDIYESVEIHEAKLPAHAPIVIEETEASGQLIPESARNILSR